MPQMQKHQALCIQKHEHLNIMSGCHEFQLLWWSARDPVMSSQVGAGATLGMLLKTSKTQIPQIKNEFFS